VASARGYAVAAYAVLLAACGGSGSAPPPITYTANSGVAQKGPLIQGSIVTAQELDAALAPSGKQYSYQVTSDLGTFTPNSKYGSQYIGINATGYYFDEVQNSVSGGTVTLNGYADLGSRCGTQVEGLEHRAVRSDQRTHPFHTVVGGSCSWPLS